MQKNNRELHFKENKNGPTLGFNEIPLIEEDGLFFKDLERTGTLLPYEDWRLDPKTRAEDLAKRLSVEEIAGLMMYSPHQLVPALPGMPFSASYGGKSFAEAGVAPWAVSDELTSYIKDNHIRYVLAMLYKDTDTAARWNNELQALAEALPHGIPVNISSDPRHGAGTAGAEYKTGSSDVSKWPGGLGMAATFDPELCKKSARVIANEYRALGIATALSPQVDLGTEPRWMRVEDTFGADPALVTDMGRAYCEGIQTDPATNGWGPASVAAMAKHWPGGGPCEAGRDAHYPFGKFAVYPGNHFDLHLKPFLEGAFRLDGGTEEAAAVMPYYAVSWGVDPSGKNVGDNYSTYLIRDLLREKYGYDGVICTDWGITGDPAPTIDSFGSRCFGVHELTEAERHLLILENGVDQFGGNYNIIPILEAYRLGCEKHGEAAMRARFEQSAVRLLLNSFRCGLFENAYLDPAASARSVGSEENCAAGFAAQLRSVVMVKNDGVLPLTADTKKKVYIPDRHISARKTFFRGPQPAQDLPGADKNAMRKYFDVTENPDEADFALCFIESPLSDGYSEETGYRPILLRYRPYTAEYARDPSIAGGDFREDFTNRSYRGKTNTAFNESDLDLVLDARKAMGDKPVIVLIRMHHPCVLAELEPYADAILVQFGVQQDALMELVTGRAEPSGLLPVQLPRDMRTVEEHCEDTPLDYEPYVDSAGNAYDFGFGLSFAGRICDERTEKYAAQKI